MALFFLLQQFAEAEWRQRKLEEEEESDSQAAKEHNEQVKNNTIDVYERGCTAVPHSSVSGRSLRIVGFCIHPLTC